MKFLVLLSLVALSASVPTPFEKHITVDVRGVGDPETNKNLEEHIFFEEPKTQWTQSGEVAQWMNQYRNVNEFNNLTPVQRVQLLLAYIKMQKHRNQWSADLTDQEYFHQMFARYFPDYIYDATLTEKQMMTHLAEYLKQYPSKYQQAMQELMSTWSPEKFLGHFLQELYKNSESLPWTRKQILEHYVRYQQYLSDRPLNAQQMNQWIEFIYHLQYELQPLFFIQTVYNYQGAGRNQAVQSQWTPAKFLNHFVAILYKSYEQLPWTHDEIEEHIKQNQQYFSDYPLSRLEITQWVEFVYHLQYQLMPLFNERNEYAQQWYVRAGQDQYTKTTWSPVKVLTHIVEELYKNSDRLPWTLEKIEEHITKDQQYLSRTPLTSRQITQWAEFVYRLQYTLLPFFNYENKQQSSKTFGQDQYMETAPARVLNNIFEQLYKNRDSLPWSREQILENITKQQYVLNTPLSSRQIKQWVEFVYSLQYQVLPMFYNSAVFAKDVGHQYPWSNEKLQQTEMNPWTNFIYNSYQKRYQQTPSVYQDNEQYEMNPWARFFYNLNQKSENNQQSQQWRNQEVLPQWARQQYEVNNPWANMYQNRYNGEQDFVHPWNYWGNQQGLPEFVRQQSKVSPWTDMYQSRYNDGQELVYPWNRMTNQQNKQLWENQFAQQQYEVNPWTNMYQTRYNGESSVFNLGQEYQYPQYMKQEQTPKMWWNQPWNREQM